MGRAKINSHKGDGLYEITYYRDTDKVDEAIINITAQITGIDERITLLLQEIGLWEAHIETLSEELSLAINDYQSCINLNGTPESCEAQLEQVTKLTKHKLEQEDLANLLVNELARLKLTKDRLNEEKTALNNAPKNEEIMDVWCLDLCARPTAEPAIGEWANVGEEIDVDTEVGIVEIFNWETKSYERWIQPASYSHDPSYISTLHGISKPSLSSSPEGFVYNFELRASANTWTAKYKIAVVESINYTDGGLYVRFPYLEDELDLSINGGLLENDDTDGFPKLDTDKDAYQNVTVDYMNCGLLLMSESAFEYGDEVIIRFDSPNMLSPVCIGFRDHPKPCTESKGFVVWDRNAEILLNLAYNETGEYWGASEVSMNHGIKHWTRKSDGAYLSFGSKWGLANGQNWLDWFISQQNKIWVNGVSYTVPSPYNNVENLMACLDENDDLIVLQGLGHYNDSQSLQTLRVIKYDWTDWTEIIASSNFDYYFHSSTWSSGFNCLADDKGRFIHVYGVYGRTVIDTTNLTVEFISFLDYILCGACTVNHVNTYYLGNGDKRYEGSIYKNSAGNIETQGTFHEVITLATIGGDVLHTISKTCPEIDGYPLGMQWDISIDDGSGVYSADAGVCTSDNSGNQFSNMIYRKVYTEQVFEKKNDIKDYLARTGYVVQSFIGGVAISEKETVTGLDDRITISGDDCSGINCPPSVTNAVTFLNRPKETGIQYNNRKVGWFPNGIYLRTDDNVDTFEKASLITALNTTNWSGTIAYLEIIGYTGGMKIWGD